MTRLHFFVALCALSIIHTTTSLGETDDAAKRDAERKRLEGLLEKMKAKGSGAKGGLTAFPMLRGWTAEAESVTVATPEGKGNKEIVYYTNTLGMKLVLIPPGEFMMGCEKPLLEMARDYSRETDNRGVPGDFFHDEFPQHRARITKAFYMGAYQVTQDQYEKFMQDNAGVFRPSDALVPVSWETACVFCKRLSEREGLTYRLPTEAEWEYACRAGTTTRYYTGETIPKGMMNSDRPANAFGLFHMVGHQSQWCLDWYDREFYQHAPESDPQAIQKPRQGAQLQNGRVTRGGHHNVGGAGMGQRMWQLRSAARGCDRGAVGFRVVCEVP